MGWALLRPLLPYGIGAILALGAVIGIYQTGYNAAAKKCNEAALRDQIRTLELDIQFAAIAEENAKKLEQAATAREDDLRERLQIYEDITADAPAVCALDAGDVERLHQLTR